jgi:hypothetical protein
MRRKRAADNLYKEQPHVSTRAPTEAGNTTRFGESGCGGGYSTRAVFVKVADCATVGQHFHGVGSFVFLLVYVRVSEGELEAWPDGWDNHLLRLRFVRGSASGFGALG